MLMFLFSLFLSFSSLSLPPSLPPSDPQIFTSSPLIITHPKASLANIPEEPSLLILPNQEKPRPAMNKENATDILNLFNNTSPTAVSVPV
jgi:hypothetical protein